MSDEEGEEHAEGEGEEEEEEGEEEAAAEEEAPVEANEEEEEVEEPPVEEPEHKPMRRPPPREESPAKDTMTEAEKAMQAAKRKHEAEEAEKMKDYEATRQIQREKEEEELRQLKEKQERRRQERQEEEQMMAERGRKEEERRRQEEEARKQKIEADKKRREEEKKKKQALMAGIQQTGGGAGKKNYEVAAKDESKGALGPGQTKAKVEVQSKEQLDESKRKYLAEACKEVDVGSMEIGTLRDKIKQLHTRISKLEADKYDLEKRHERQEYDLKELNERQRQMSRNKALARGLDPEEAANSVHPPKLPTASKYDRQIDRRSYGDRHTMFQSPSKQKESKVFHGSARPPPEWGRKENEELEVLRKNLEPPKYIEQVKIENAKPPMAAIPTKMPEVTEARRAQLEEEAMESRMDTSAAEENDEEAGEDVEPPAEDGEGGGEVAAEAEEEGEEEDEEEEGEEEEEEDEEAEEED